VRAGRISLIVALLLVGVALVSASTGGEEAAVPGAVKTPGAPRPAQVEARLPARREVRVPPGAVVRLRVAAPASDRARIVRLGLDWPVGPGIEGDVVFVAPASGRFGVVLRDAGTRIGTLAVTG
jgi:hypothetical protein